MFANRDTGFHGHTPGRIGRCRGQSAAIEVEAFGRNMAAVTTFKLGETNGKLGLEMGVEGSFPVPDRIFRQTGLGLDLS